MINLLNVIYKCNQCNKEYLFDAGILACKECYSFIKIREDGLMFAIDYIYNNIRYEVCHDKVFRYNYPLNAMIPSDKIKLFDIDIYLSVFDIKDENFKEQINCMIEKILGNMCLF